MDVYFDVLKRLNDAAEAQSAAAIFGGVPPAELVKYQIALDHLCAINHVVTTPQYTYRITHTGIEALRNEQSAQRSLKIAWLSAGAAVASAVVAVIALGVTVATLCIG